MLKRSNEMRRLILTTILLANSIIFSQSYTLTEDYEIITEKLGDLDNDGIDEKVIVINTKDSTENGFIREIQILKLSKNTWVEWKKSRNAILKSDEGGMMGDPFEGIEIKNNVLLISHFGGSSWKWGNVDKYRFQNNQFELIGHTSNYGKLCEYWANFDFNISTGKIAYKKEFEDCDNNQTIYKTEKEVFLKKGLKINLNNRFLNEIKIISPNLKVALYL